MAKNFGTIQKEHQVVRDKFLKGMKLSFKKLVKEASLRDEKLVFSVERKIRSIRARKIKG